VDEQTKLKIPDTSDLARRAVDSPEALTPYDVRELGRLCQDQRVELARVEGGPIVQKVRALSKLSPLAVCLALLMVAAVWSADRCSELARGKQLSYDSCVAEKVHDKCTCQRMHWGGKSEKLDPECKDSLRRKVFGTRGKKEVEE
jgi:hypothetical protein